MLFTIENIRQRLNSGVYGLPIETHEEARNRRSEEIRDLRRQQARLESVMDGNIASAERLTEAREALRRAEAELPTIRRRVTVYGFVTPIPALSIRIAK